MLCHTDYKMVTPGGLKIGGFGNPGCLWCSGFAWAGAAGAETREPTLSSQLRSCLALTSAPPNPTLGPRLFVCLPLFPFDLLRGLGFAATTSRQQGSAPTSRAVNLESSAVLMPLGTESAPGPQHKEQRRTKEPFTEILKRDSLGPGNFPLPQQKL